MLGAPEEILPVVHHWTAFQRELTERVSSYSVEPAGALIDPMVPEAGPGWFETPGVRPQHVVLTSHRHWRETDRFAEAFRCLVRCPLPALKLLEDGRSARTRTACATACGTRSAACCCAASTRCCSRTASRCRTTATPPCAASSSGRSASPATATR